MGLSPEEAQRHARLRLGASGAIVEKVREGEVRTMLESLYKDFTLGLRSLRRNPVFAITAILTLAVDIGANTIVFTLLHGLLLRSLPVNDPASLVRIGLVAAGDVPDRQSETPYQMMLQLGRQQRSFTGMFAWRNAVTALESEEGAGQVLAAAIVDGRAFEILGLTPALGRLLTVADDVPGGPAGGWPVVLGYGYWQDAFGGDPAVLGKQLKLAKTTVTIAGVAPRSFRGLWNGSETKIYLPLPFANVLAGRNILDEPGAFWVVTMARLKRGVSLDAARAELRTYDKALVEQFIPDDLGVKWCVLVGDLRWDHC